MRERDHLLALRSLLREEFIATRTPSRRASAIRARKKRVSVQIAGRLRVKVLMLLSVNSEFLLACPLR